MRACNATVETTVAQQPAINQPQPQTRSDKETKSLAKEVADHVGLAKKSAKVLQTLAKERVANAKATVKALGKTGAADLLAEANARLKNAEALSRLAKHANTGLAVVGSIVSTKSRINASAAQTLAGKLVDGFTGTVVNTAAGKILGFSIIDEATGKSLSKTLGGSVSAVTVIGEGLCTQDTRGLEKFHRDSLAGKHGFALKAASTAGDFYAKEGVAHTLRDAARQIWNR